MELIALMNVLVVLVTLKVGGDYMLSNIKLTANHFWNNVGGIDLTPELFLQQSVFIMRQLTLILLPVFVVVVLAGLLSNIMQVGFQVSFEPLKPAFDKINPAKGFQRIFSRRSMIDLVKAMIKIVIIGYIFYSTVRKIFNDIFNTPLMDIDTYLIFVGSTVFSLGMKMLAAFAVFSIADYIYQKWEFEDSIKMTKQEIKDEMKQMEGDPLIKARIRNIQREMARKRMIAEIPHADVVITNPTHAAVALRYKEGEDNAPVIVARGLNYMAQRIKQIARDNKVVVVENAPLARALVKYEVGWEVPPEFFQAIAEILAYVYQVKGKIRLEEKGKKLDNIPSNNSENYNTGLANESGDKA